MELIEAVQHLPRGWTGHYFASVASTQDEARRAALASAPDRSIFVADHQTAGRGRHGRRWLDQPGTALMLSIVWRDSDANPRPWRWTRLTSVALAEAIDATVPSLVATIKWPNDVLLDGRKVAGVLAESSFDGTRLTLVVGIGINVSSTSAELAEVHPNATSLAVAGGRSVARGPLLLALLTRLDALAAQPDQVVADAWQRRLWGRGQRLKLVDVDGEQDVVVLGATAEGYLQVQLADGSVRTTTTGELIL